MYNYSPVGDLLVSSVCFVMIVLVLFSYNRHTRSFRIFLALIGFLILAADTNVAFNMLGTSDSYPHLSLIYVLRCIYHASLFSIFLLFVIYITEVTRLERKKKNWYIVIAILIWFTVIAADVTETVSKTGIKVTSNGIIYSGIDIFLWGYIAFLALLIVLLIRVRNRLYRNVMMGFYGTICISFLMLILQNRHGQSSFTVATFLYPVIGMFYIMHSDPYDVQLGAVDSRALEDMVRDSFERKREFSYLSLYLHNISEEGKMIPNEMQSIVRKYAEASFKGSMLFLADKGHIVLTFPAKRNPDHEKRLRILLDSFYKEHARFKEDYKIIIGHSIQGMSRDNKYLSFINYIHRHMDENSIHRVDEKDVKEFYQMEYILRQLQDIYEKEDMEDPRVLAYCQPVYNIRTKKYDTAEALMRLKLDETGLVFPDQFIPLAEENGYIHMLTKIILHKTCREVKTLLKEGYEVARISVNVSALELKDESFCNDINRIIDECGITGDKIAIELTESQNEADFILMKEKINQLKNRGIKFYLDDFGTGYSNMERIMELPFDIIKFDRSLVLASDASDRSKEIVSGLAGIFSRMKYSVLYEGVEKDADEIMCIDMDASFLQGYKYSRPVPIKELEHFFEKHES